MDGKTRKKVMINVAAIVYFVPTTITINKSRPKLSVPKGGNIFILYGAGRGFPLLSNSNGDVGIRSLKMKK